MEMVDQEMVLGMARMIEELQDRMESLELANDPEVMEGLVRSRKQIEKGELVDFNEL